MPLCAYHGLRFSGLLTFVRTRNEHIVQDYTTPTKLKITILAFPSHQHRTQAEVYGVAIGTPVALRAPSVPTALTYGDESTLKTPSFCLDNG